MFAFVFICDEMKNISWPTWIREFLHKLLLGVCAFHSFNQFISQRTTIDQTRRNQHAHDTRHSLRLIQRIRNFRFLAGYQIWCFSLCSPTTYNVAILSAEFSNDSRRTNINIQNPFRIVSRRIWPHDSSQRVITSLTSAAFCDSFFPFLLCSFEILYGVESTGKLINATSHMQRGHVYVCVSMTQ